MEKSFACWQSKIPLDSESLENSKGNWGQAMITSAKPDGQVPAVDGSRVTVYASLDHLAENGRKYGEEEQKGELRRVEDEEEDGVHGGRMKPLASFDVNRPSQRRHFQFCESTAGSDNLPNKAAGLKATRRPRDRVNSSSAPRLAVLNHGNENNGGLVPLCPGKTHIRGMKPENGGPKAASHCGISRTFGKKRSRMKMGGGEIEHGVKVAPGSTDHWQGGGMDLLLMVLDSGLVEADEQQQNQQATKLCPSLEVIKPECNDTRSQYSAEKLPVSRTKKPAYERLSLPYIPKSEQPADKFAEIQPDDEENCEGTADDPIISSRMGLPKSLSSSKLVCSDEDSDTQSESSPRACPKNSKITVLPKYVQTRDIKDETCAEEAGKLSNFEDEITLEAEKEFGQPLQIARDVHKAEFSRVLQHESSASDSAENLNSICLELSANLLSNSNFPMEKKNQRQEERNTQESESSSTLRVFHKPSLIIAHDIRPSLIQPVKIVGRLGHCMVTNLGKGMETSPMELGVGLLEVMKKSQARECTSNDPIPQMSRLKKRKAADHVSAFRPVKMTTSMGICGDQTCSSVAIPSCSESDFRKFADPAHCQNNGRTKVQGIQPCVKAWCSRAENPNDQRHAGLQQKTVRSLSSLRPRTCQYIDSGLPYILKQSHCVPEEDGKLPHSMFWQERSESGLDCQNHDEILSAPPELVTVAHFGGSVEAVPDLVTVVQDATEHKELSSTVSQTLQPETQIPRERNPPVEPLLATGFHIGDTQTKVSAPFCKKRRRNVPLVASHFQDNHQVKTSLSNPWFESGESLGQCAVQVSAGASTVGGSHRVGTERKGRRRMGPRKAQAGRPRTKVLAQSYGNFSNFIDSNSSVDYRTEMARSGAACNNLSSCCIQEGTDVKCIRQRRGHKKAQQESLKSKRSLSIAGRFKRLSEPSGFLGEFNPGIMQRVRNSQQIHAVLGALVGVAASKVANETSIITKVGSEVSLGDPISSPQAGRHGDGPVDGKPLHHNSLTAMTRKDSICYGSLHEKPKRISSSFRDTCNGSQAEQGIFQYKVHDDNPQETEGVPHYQQTREDKSFHCSIPDDLLPSHSMKCVETSCGQGKVHMESGDFYTLKPEDHDTCPHKSSTVDPNNDRRCRTFIQHPSPASPEAAGLATQWLELLTLDIKGRLSALKRSRRRVRTLLVSGQLGNAKAPPVDHLGGGESRPAETKKVFSDAIDCVTWATEHTRMEAQVDKWRALFTNMDGVLCMEAAKLESNLWQIQQMVVLCQDPKHFLATGPVLPIVPDFSAGKENFPPPKWPFSTETMVPEVAVAASAVSILSTASFLTKS